MPLRFIKTHQNKLYLFTLIATVLTVILWEVSTSFVPLLTSFILMSTLMFVCTVILILQIFPDLFVSLKILKK